MIDGETIFSLLENMWIGDWGILYNITNDATDLYNVTNFDKLMNGSLGSMSATKKVCQVDSSEKLQVTLPMKYCTKAGVKLFLLTFKLVQGSKVRATVKTILLYCPQVVTLC